MKKRTFENQLEIFHRAEEIIRKSRVSFNTEGCSDIIRFLDLFATAFAFNLLKTELSPKLEIKDIFRLDFSVNYFLDFVGKDGIDLLYTVIHAVCRSYTEGEAYEIGNSFDTVINEVQDLIRHKFPDIDPAYFSTKNPEEMNKIALSRIKATLRTWIH